MWAGLATLSLCYDRHLPWGAFALVAKGLAHWNVLHSPWLEAMDLQGRLQRVTVIDALKHAGELQRLVASSPLDLFAAHRFIVTLLFWQSTRCGGVKKLREALLGGKVPPKLIESLETERGQFDLFDAARPFLQDPKAKGKATLPASYLFAEMATGTNIAHFHHGDDAACQLCLQCATLGLLRLVPWTQAGGRSKKPSVHGAPPIVALALGPTLAGTLGLNLVPTDSPLGQPQWSGQFELKRGGSGIGLLEAMTWKPRRVHLGDARVGLACSRCGEPALPVVGPIVFESYPACSSDAALQSGWRDPAAFYPKDKGRAVKSGRESPAARDEDLQLLYTRQCGKREEPAPHSQVVAANGGHEAWLVIVPCTRQAKTFDHRMKTLTQLGESHRSPAPDSDWTKEYCWQASTVRTTEALPPVRPTDGMRRFVRAAAELDSESWNVLAAAQGRELSADPAAFDIFTGLYWPLRKRDTSLPSRNAAWLALKLMASVGAARPRAAKGLSSPFRPWLELQRSVSPIPAGAYRRQSPTGRSHTRTTSGPTSPLDAYRRQTPTGRALEDELRRIILTRHAKDSAGWVDWAGLCQFVHDSMP